MNVGVQRISTTQVKENLNQTAKVDVEMTEHKPTPKKVTFADELVVELIEPVQEVV
jgi:hypothetical protein